MNAKASIWFKQISARVKQLRKDIAMHYEYKTRNKTSCAHAWERTKFNRDEGWWEYCSACKSGRYKKIVWPAPSLAQQCNHNWQFSFWDDDTFEGYEYCTNCHEYKETQ